MNSNKNPNLLSAFKRGCSVFVISIFCCIQLYGDTAFDVVSFSNGLNKIYVRCVTLGMLRGNDLCYYNYRGEYINEVQHYLFNARVNTGVRDSIEIYSELVTLDATKIYPKYSAALGKPYILYILKKRSKISIQQLIEEYEITGAFNGNSFAVSTGIIEQTDNYWIKDYPIEKYFTLNNNEWKAYVCCELSLFGIEGNMTKIEKQELRIKLNGILSDDTIDIMKEFQAELKKLHSKNIIMLGSCGC